MHPSASQKGASRGHDKSGGGGDDGGKSPVTLKHAREFLAGKGSLTPSVMVGLHQHLGPLAAKVIAAHKRGAKLGAAVGGHDDLKKMVLDPKFEWTKDQKKDKEGKDPKGGQAAKGGQDGKGAPAAKGAPAKGAKAPVAKGAHADVAAKTPEKSPAPVADKGAKGQDGAASQKSAHADGDHKGGGGATKDAPAAQPQQKAEAGGHDKGAGGDQKASGADHKGEDHKLPAEELHASDQDAQEAKRDVKHDGANGASDGKHAAADGKHDGAGDGKHAAADGKHDGAKTASDGKHAASDGKHAASDGKHAASDGKHAASDGKHAAGDGKHAAGDGKHAASDGKHAASDGKHAASDGKHDGANGASDGKHGASDGKHDAGGKGAGGAQGGGAHGADKGAKHAAADGSHVPAAKPGEKDHKKPAKGDGKGVPTGGANGGIPKPAAFAKGGAGGGGGGAPSPGPAATGGAPATVAEPDGYVDFYMEKHFESKRFDELAKTLKGTPINNMVEGKAMLPAPATGPTATGVSWIAGMATGAIDGVLWGALKAIPGIGLGPIFLDFAKALNTNINDQKKLHSNNADTQKLVDDMFKVQILRTTADWLGSSAGNLASLCSVIQEVGLAAAPIGGVSLVLELAAAAGIPLRAVQAEMDWVKTFADMIMMVGNVFIAKRLDAEGNKEGAAKAREMARGNATDAILDGLSAIMDTCDVIGNLAPGSDAMQPLKQVAKDAKPMDMDKLIGQVTEKSLMKGVQALPLLGDKSADPLAKGGALSRPDLLKIKDGADKVTKGVGYAGKVGLKAGLLVPGTSGGDGVDAVKLKEFHGVGDAAKIMGPAHEKGMAKLKQSEEALTKAPPLWYQKLVKDFLDAGSTGNQVTAALDFATSPTAMLGAMLRTYPGMQKLTGLLDDPRAAPTLAAALEKMAPWAHKLDPLCAEVTAWIKSNKKDWNESLIKMSNSLTTYQINLGKVNVAIDYGRGVVAKVNTLADKKGSISSKADQAIDKLKAARINDPTKYHIQTIDAHTIQKWAHLLGPLGDIGGGILSHVIPQAMLDKAKNTINGLIDHAIGAWNAKVDGLLAEAHKLKDQALAKVDAWIHSTTAGIDDKLAALQEELKEGGEIQKILQEEKDKVAKIVAMMVDAFTKWDGTIKVDFIGAANFILDVVKALRDSANMKVDEKGNDDLKKKWADVIKTEAIPFIASWKKDHGDQVKEALDPPAPVEEIAAFDTAVGLVDNLISSWQAHAQAAAKKAAGNPAMGGDPVTEPNDHNETNTQAEIDHYKSSTAKVHTQGDAAKGQKGQKAFNAIWSAEEALVVIENQVRTRMSKP